jgi:hypothetical protein
MTMDGVMLRAASNDVLNREPSAEAIVIYTCPMHPQVRHTEPANCPICGMSLEPLAVTAANAPNAELADMSRRFWIALALTLPVFLLEMGSHFPALAVHEVLPARESGWIQFALSTPVVLWAGFPFFQRGSTSVTHRSLSGAGHLFSDWPIPWLDISFQLCWRSPFSLLRAGLVKRAQPIFAKAGRT